VYTFSEVDLIISRLVTIPGWCEIPVLTVHLHQIPVCVFTGVSRYLSKLYLHQIPVCVFRGFMSDTCPNCTCASDTCVCVYRGFTRDTCTNCISSASDTCVCACLHGFHAR